MLRDRYPRDGDLTDLDDAVGQLATAWELTPDEGQERPSRLDQLATTLRLRALRRGNAGELRRAVDIHREAARLATVPAEQTTLLNNLAGSLRAWAAAADGQAILDEAAQRSTRMRSAAPVRRRSR